jgi:hypothetical protein
MGIHRQQREQRRQPGRYSTEVVDGQVRFTISTALVNEFLPHRKQVLERSLDGNLLLKLIPLRPIGGFLTH